MFLLRRTRKTVLTLFLLLIWNVQPVEGTTAVFFFIASIIRKLQNFLREILGRDDAPYGSCVGCFCIVSDEQTCPTEQEPDTDFGHLIPIFRSLTWTNPYSLNCNPHDDDDEAPCDIDPPYQDGGGACVVQFTNNTAGEGGAASSSSADCSRSYTISTYPGTFEEAKANNSVYVTHEGPCGTCSSLQDLSVLMETGPKLRDLTADCAIYAGYAGMDAGVRCYKDLGFTEGCSVSWYYNALKTRDECGLICLTFLFLDKPPNGPGPDCELAKCLQCDEKNAGPAFLRTSGRTRRNSGLMSNFARPCSDTVDLTHEDPCSWN